MPDLGKHSDTVLSAYAVSIVLLLLLVGISLWRGHKVRAEMARTEARVKRNG